ncbi:MAG: hypothetical protein Q7J27_14620 [Syntrophales bacterium]|nr:hypothetical protein [Syntrophales bacterium]
MHRDLKDPSEAMEDRRYREYLGESFGDDEKIIDREEMLKIDRAIEEEEKCRQEKRMRN